ncbi:MazG-like nucleotide pyrophsphohydrolase [Burkholderia phage vB_BpP_HN04]|nr:MazG-like nucleotide pyrophsphohydrolase [Burkholderia phage vB_BpP_HN01]
MLEQMAPEDSHAARLIHDAYVANKALGQALKAGECSFRVKNDVLFLDALIDQIVTATGTGYGKGYNMDGALEEVNASNWSKFDGETPIFQDNDPDKKILKGPNYFKADLSSFI